uniref:Uncharacterized protein n=1 Tax=Anopheles culicifacies TaxID=139723 RepID=A0A182MP08_9DIPT
MAAAALSSLMASTSQFTQFQNTLNFVNGGAIVASSSTSSHISTGSAASVSSSRSAGSTGGGDTHTSSAGNSVGAAGSGSDSTASCTTTMDGNEDTGSHVNSFDSTLAALAGTSTSQTTDHVGEETAQRKMRSHPPDLPTILMGASHVANLHLIDEIDRRGGDSDSSSGQQLRHHDDTNVSVVDDEAA